MQRFHRSFQEHLPSESSFGSASAGVPAVCRINPEVDDSAVRIRRYNPRARW